MEASQDFLQLLNRDLSLKIFSYLYEPADVFLASSVSHSWRKFVIANGVSKSLSLRCCPETSCAIKAIEDDDIIEPLEVETNGSVEMEKLKKNHRVYAFLARRLHYYVTRDCISEAICASSTNNYLKENIHNTLVLNGGTSYWSSRGEISPDVPETLTYKLVPELRFITKIRIHLIQALVQAVRFRMCHFREPEREADLAGDYEPYPTSF
ncbi:F-box protein At4g00755-like [Papaver somniferum]|uniref:F-box protein At4g00755-like n=1 Tax=Papaver somniferum TaxID=3469 RepID=UPI000E6FE8C5|nr:F-box protein At4g00755-like [Papaver somniferum]